MYTSSFRRDYLDNCLVQYQSLFKGRVLDVGGKKSKRRGRFIPPFEQVTSWEYLNSDVTTEPDYCGFADDIPLENNSVDIVVMTEVLEYLSEPEKVFLEIERVLCTGGVALISTPFLHPVHGDYWNDRVRYTPVMLREISEKVNLTLQSLEPMGSVGAVLYDILRISSGYASKGGFTSKVASRVLPMFSFFFKFLDVLLKHQQEYINTGYFIVLKKY